MILLVVYTSLANCFAHLAEINKETLLGTIRCTISGHAFRFLPFTKQSIVIALSKTTVLIEVVLTVVWHLHVSGRLSSKALILSWSQKFAINWALVVTPCTWPVTLGFNSCYLTTAEPESGAMYILQNKLVLFLILSHYESNEKGE